MLKYIVSSGAAGENNRTNIDYENDIVAPTKVEAATTAVKVPATKIVLRYNSNWEKTYSWLLHKDGRMFCRLCTAAKKDNSFAKEGAGIITIWLNS